MPVFTFVDGIALLLLGISIPVHPLQYYFINNFKSWNEAQTYCRQNYIDLATIDNMEDVKKLRLAAAGYVGRAWIGLRVGGPVKWVWSDSSQNVSYTNWATANPRNNSGDCVAMDEQGQWVNRACESNLNMSCYYNTIDNPFMYVHFGYWTWYTSQSHCRYAHSGMSVVMTQKQNDDIQKQASGNLVWIGLSRDIWSWSDGSNNTFRYWKTGKPDNDGNCGTIWLDELGSFDDWNCISINPFFCQGTITTKTLMTVKTVIRSTVDLTEQVASNQLQKQLENELKNQNLNFQVNWKSHEDGQVFKLAGDEGEVEQSAGGETLEVRQCG